MCGSVSFCQRFGSLLDLNVHFHRLLPDGVFVAKGSGVEFLPIPPPWPEDVYRLVGQIARATEKHLERRLHDQSDDEPAGLLELELELEQHGGSFLSACS